ncbi:unnamed protein product [Colias eurytheme]|nr:unnamed protein product [Colias eurytheme]
MARKINDAYQNNNHPFVVYSASVPTQNEDANIVKLQVLKPETGRSIVTFARDKNLKDRLANATRYNPVQRPIKKNNVTFTTTTKAPFSPSKSRFSANRAQNVPVDLRKKSTTKSSRTFSTESPKPTTERRVFIKASRPTRPAFVPRRLTTPSTNDDS